MFMIDLVSILIGVNVAFKVPKNAGPERVKRGRNALKNTCALHSGTENQVLSGPHRHQH